MIYYCHQTVHASNLLVVLNGEVFRSWRNDVHTDVVVTAVHNMLREGERERLEDYLCDRC